MSALKMFIPPLQISEIMRGFAPDWFIAGGWAIDLFLGAESRPHQDIEIAVFRPDQAALRRHLSGWTLKKARRGALIDWQQDEYLTLPTHEIHCFNETALPPQFEILLNESNESEWIYRRQPEIKRSLSKSRRVSNTGVRFLASEIVLLYKSKNPRSKDEQDFQAVAEHLDAKQKEWLMMALRTCYSEHHWIKSL